VRGRLPGLVVAVAAFAAPTFSAGPIDACSTAPPPLTLVGMPADGESNVPTSVVPVYDIVPLLSNLDESRLGLATFELVSDAGVSVPLAARMTYIWHFELVPERALLPRTAYALRAVLPASSQMPESVTLGLSFTTGDGPLDQVPVPPPARIEHWVSSGVTNYNSCSPSMNGTCISFESGTAIDALFVGSSEHYLYFDAFLTDLTGVDQGTPYTCVELRTRALDGTTSDPLTLCRGDGARFPVSGNINGLECTENGLMRDGAPIDAEPEGDPPGSRTVLTEGCGCSLPGRARSASTVLSIALALSLFARRRAAGRRS
jgi:hypothetical protein